MRTYNTNYKLNGTHSAKEQKNESKKMKLKKHVVIICILPTLFFPATGLANISQAGKYFTERKRPTHHFLDMGIGGTLIKSLYPFEMNDYPFFAYLNYRREKWGQTKIPVIFSLQYENLFSKRDQARIHGLTGLRYPLSHDLTLFHVDFMIGFSLPFNFSFKTNQPAVEFRLLFTHIVGPKAGTNRLYFQWGAKGALTETKIRSGLAVQIGMDNHL